VVARVHAEGRCGWIPGVTVTTSPTPSTGWEAPIYDHEPDSWYNHPDLWRAEPAGRFYAYRGFEDVSEGRGYPEAMTTLDFGRLTHPRRCITLPTS
jgi:hypothetical protein